MDEKTPVPENIEVKSYEAGKVQTSKPIETEVQVKSFEKKSGSSMDPKMAGMLCYLCGWITGLIFFIMEKEERYVRFHAIQSLMWSVGALLVWLAMFIFFVVIGIVFQSAGALRSIATSLVGILALGWGVGNVILWLKLMSKAKKGEWYKIPVLGDKADEVA